MTEILSCIISFIIVNNDHNVSFISIVFRETVTQNNCMCTSMFYEYPNTESKRRWTPVIHLIFIPSSRLD